jgi:hypothetical protein
MNILAPAGTLLSSNVSRFEERPNITVREDNGFEVD